MRLKGSMLVAVAIALVMALTATGPALAQQLPEQADLRAVHAVPGGPAVDVFVDNNPVFSNLQYGQASDYAAVQAGPHTVVVVPAGAGPQGQALINTAVNLGGGSYNTLAAVGQPNSVRPLTLVNESTLPATNRARVRVVHASPNAPAVDVVPQGGQPLVGNVSFPSASSYQTVEARTYNLDIRQAGTNNVVKSLPNVALNGGTVYSIFAIGLLNGQPPLDAIVVADAPPTSACRPLVGAPAAAGTPGAETPTAVGTPTTPAATPATPVGTPGTPAATPGTPAVTPGTPAGTPGTPAGTPGTPAATPGTPVRTPGTPAATPGTPAATPGTPAATPGTPAGTPGTPVRTPGTPAAGGTPGAEMG